jgi:hypothetical protein
MNPDKIGWCILIGGSTIVLAYMVMRTDIMYVTQLFLLPVIFFALTLAGLVGLYHIHKRFVKNGLN